MLIYDVNRYSEDVCKLPDTIVLPDDLEKDDVDATVNAIIEFVEKMYGRKPSAFGCRANGQIIRYRA